MQGAKVEPMQVLARYPVVVKAGDQVELRGLGFKSNLALSLLDQSGSASAQTVPVTVESSDTARFTVPQMAKPGIYQLNASQDRQSQTLSLVFTADMLESAVFASDAQYICVGQTFYDLAGNLREGSKTCEAKECSQDGEVDCLATMSFRATATKDIEKRVIFGATVAGVAGAVKMPEASRVIKGVEFGLDQLGTLTIPAASDVRQSVVYGPDFALTGSLNPGATLPANCNSDGETGCVAVSNYPAVDRINKLVGGNVKSGVTIAGVVGNVFPKPVDCASDGATSCVAVTAYPAVKRANFIASDIKTGRTIAGVAGSLNDCSVDGSTSCVAILPYRAALTTGLASKVVSGNTVAGIVGSATAESHSDCAADGSTGCVAISTFPAARLANFVASDMKTGKTVAGVIGSLNNCSADGSSSCVATPTYTAALTTGLAPKVVSGATVAGIAGTSVVPSVSAVISGVAVGVAGVGNVMLPDAGDVRLGITFGSNSLSTGELDPGAGVPAGCNTDSQVNCVANTNYPAARIAGFWATDLKYGRTVAGVVGTLIDCSTDGSSSCVATPTYTAALTTGLAPKVVSGNTVAGIAGSATAESHSDCAADGGTGCVAISTFPAARLANFFASDVKTGKTVAGVIGSLNNCSVDGSSSCVATPTYTAAFTIGLAPKVLSGNTVAGIAGTATAESHSDCAADGGTGCVAISTFPAARLANFVASDMKTGKTVAGVIGSLTNCSADGSSSCVATPPYTAAFTIGLAPKVLSGNTVAGIAGSATAESHSDCAVDGGTGCIAISTFPAARLANFFASDVKTGKTVAGVIGSLNNCSVDGSSSCVATPTYTAALTTGLAPRVLSGNTVAGIAGSATAESHSDCAVDGGTGCIAISTFPAARLANFFASDVKTGKTVAGVIGSLTNCSVDGSSSCVATPTYTAALTTGLAPKVLSGNTVAGIAGSATAESHSNCATDGSTGCVTVAGFKAADMTRAVASNIKSGSTIAGVIGSYPSSSYPLAGADSTTDLDFATFDARIKSASSFEWFDSSGTRYTNTGDADIVTGNIANSVTIFGTTGTLASGSNCTSDGQTSCMTTSRYKSMDTDASVISAWDIRKGKTAGGLGGEIVFYKNMANTTLFNRTSGTSALAGVDFYDTIDDYNNNGAFPTQNPTGWDQATGANWLRDSVSDVGGGTGGVAGDGICNGSEDCVFRDRITGLSWLRDNATLYTWEDAITYCEGSTSGGYSDWRLPTQKELMQAYTDGVWSQKDATRLALTTGYYYWSSSTRSNGTTDAWFVALFYGITNLNYTKTNTFRVLCVR